MKTGLVRCVVASALMIVLSLPALAIQYRMTDLGTMDGTGASPYAINDAGQIVGVFLNDTDDQLHGFVYTPGEGSEELGFMGGMNCYATDIATDGTVAGFVQYRNYDYQGYTSELDVQMTPIGSYNSQVYAMNDQHQAVGQQLTYIDGRMRTRAFVYTPGGDVTYLGDASSSAYGINNHGQVVGRGSGDQGFIYTPGSGMSDFGSLPGAGCSCAMDINDAGQVSGYALDSSGNARAVLYTPGTGLFDLGTLGGDTGTGVALNGSGHVVGISALGDGSRRPFVYTPAVGMMELPILAGHFWGSAMDINSSGQILGISYAGEYDSFGHVILWEPVPEPSGLLALGAGLLSVVRLIRRKR